MTEEISRIGCERTPSEPEISSGDIVQPFSSEDGNAALDSSAALNEDRNEKQIEDYPLPLAVVGVSVL